MSCPYYEHDPWNGDGDCILGKEETCENCEFGPGRKFTEEQRYDVRVGLKWHYNMTKKEVDMLINTWSTYTVLFAGTNKAVPEYIPF